MLETVFEFVFSKMTSAKFKPCNEFKPSDILRAGSKLFQSMAVCGKSQFFKKNEVCVNKRNVVHVSCQVLMPFFKSQIENILKMFDI